MREDDELREEIESHVRMRAEHDGIRLADARKRFGNTTRIQEEMRSMHTSIFVDQLLQDLRYAIRRASRQPAFTLAVIATIALGIGATAAVFSVVDRILFRSLPYANEDQLVWLGMTAPIGNDEFLLGGDYFDWREQQQAFSHFTASDGGGAECDVTEANTPIRVHCIRFAYDYLTTFGIAPVLGRTFTKEEDRHDGPKAVMISHALWQSRYGGSSDALEKTLELNGIPYRIVGVLPRNFEVPSLAQIDVAQPLALNEQAQRERKGTRMVRGWARLKPGVSLQQARAAMQPVFERSLQYVPKAFVKEVKLKITSLRERQVKDSRSTSLALLAAVLCVLLIACANVMNLFLARASASAREFSIREAIGASRSRLVRQSLTESILICLIGGVFGLALGYALLHIAIHFAPPGIPRILDATLDARVVVVAVLLTLAAGLFSGFRIQTPSRSWMRPALVTMQIALATCLIYATGLLGESLWKMQNVPLGIATDHLLSARVDLLAKESGKRDEIWNALKERVSVLPGIESQTLSDSLPPSQRSSSMIYSRISADGKPEDLRGGTGGMVCIRFIAPSYFQTLRISILKGRSFTDRETDAIIISQRLARRLFDGAIDVLGRSIRPGTGETWRTIVGVVADVNNNGIETGDPEYYLPLASESGPNHLYLTARTGGDPQLIADLIRAEVHALDPHVPLTFETMEQRSSKLTERSRFNAAILTFFAIAGLLIGTLGVYGVVCFLISQRRKEVAVRMAVGATRTQIRNLILGTAIRWTVAGMVASAALMAAALPLVRHLLFETPPARPLLMLVAIVVMTGAVLCASLGPANRAANSDPMPILKQD